MLDIVQFKHIHYAKSISYRKHDILNGLVIEFLPAVVINDRDKCSVLQHC